MAHLLNNRFSTEELQKALAEFEADSSYHANQENLAWVSLRKWRDWHVEAEGELVSSIYISQNAQGVYVTAATMKLLASRFKLECVEQGLFYAETNLGRAKLKLPCAWIIIPDFPNDIDLNDTMRSQAYATWKDDATQNYRKAQDELWQWYERKSAMVMAQQE